MFSVSPVRREPAVWHVARANRTARHADGSAGRGIIFFLSINDLIYIITFYFQETLDAIPILKI